MSHSPLCQHQLIARPVSEVFPFFESAHNLEDLTPPWLGFRIAEAPSDRLMAGDRLLYRLRLFGVPLRWETRIERLDPDRGFVDVQVKGPYRMWVHTHQFEHRGDTTLMEDRVDYRLPFGPLGRLVAPLIALQLRAIFAYRFRRVADLFPPLESGASAPGEEVGPHA